MHLPHAAGALGSTAEDMLAWSEALRGGKAVTAEDYAAMTTPGRLNDGEATSYGLGLLLSRYRNHRRIGHGGGINGFLSDLAYWPDHDFDHCGRVQQRRLPDPAGGPRPGAPRLGSAGPGARTGRAG